jgi:poly(3-hydroxybutyrate) depolymerase
MNQKDGWLAMKLYYRLHYSPFMCLAFVAILSLPACAQDAERPGHRLQTLREMLANKKENEAHEAHEAHEVSEEALGAHSQNVAQDSFDGRDMILYIPSRLPPPGQRGMVVALHGGGGNARYMQAHLKMDGIAERHGFIVAYLNGSNAAGRFAGNMKAWDAGNGCCGAAYNAKVDDIGYIGGAVHYLARKYGVDPKRVYGIGHSNGAMMTQTLMCETDLYDAAVSLAGALMAEAAVCPNARGKTILAIHGADDANVPPGGGKGTKGVTNIDYRSEVDSKALFERAGGKYFIQWLPGTDHGLEHIGAALQRTEGISLAEKAARFFGLAPDR